MSSARIVGTLLLTGALLMVGLLAPGSTQAQMGAPDQIIGPQSEGTSLTDGVMATPNDKPTAKDREQGFERPLKVPDRMEEADGTHLRLRTPDQVDAEDIGESDERAATSF
ncbi:MAG TPA: hypothetical protein VJ805_01380 [Nitrospiraceae bacterium]|nr:hypothetical protein [Nitrospiraceae bacterium]